MCWRSGGDDSSHSSYDPTAELKAENTQLKKKIQELEKFNIEWQAYAKKLEDEIKALKANAAQPTQQPPTGGNLFKKP